MSRWRAIFFAIMVAASAVTTFGQSGVRPSPSPPPLPYFEWNACPFEGCTYREWSAEAAVPLYDTWKKSRTQIGALTAGEKVVALTGVVITYKPSVVRYERDTKSQQADIPDFKRGDRILVYAYHGEGVFTAWYKGRLYDGMFVEFGTLSAIAVCQPNCEATYLEGQKEWWAQVRLRSGRTAWVWMDHAKFDGVDALG